MKQNILYFLGNSLMVVSLVGFLVIFYPFFSLFIFPPVIKHIPLDKGFFITIPKIQAQSRIIPSVDPWHEQVYRKALEHGVAQAAGTAVPGQHGTIYLFAHSSDVPWRVTRDNIPFLRLGDLTVHDAIIIDWDGKKYTYTVVDKKIVWPTAITYLLNSKKDQLILQTCFPIGTSFQRLLVFATLTN